MACCSSFTAVAARPPADPSRHVNFTAGMVLGVDDYQQEFAYHSARDKWIVRELGGYGTLSGLAVDLETGAEGPRIRVSAGAAAAPSGQLICVARDQCGPLNAWLARPLVKETVDKLANGQANATLQLYLTLCYVDCAVADVPIPGEPCRDDENLMAPSRVADDYCLEYRFEPPPMSEARALDALTAFWATLDIAAGNPDTPAAFETAMKRAEAQLRLALGIADPQAPAPAADLDPIKLNPAAKDRFAVTLKRLWVTRLRPRTMAVRCGGAPLPVDDCVLLARLSVAVVEAGDHWEVDGAAGSVRLDESERPLLLAASLAQTVVGAAMAVDARQQKIAFVTADTNLTADVALAVVQAAAEVKVKVPAATAATAGRALTVKAGEAKVVLTTPAATKIDGQNSLDLEKRGSATLVSDGANSWHVIAGT